MTRDDRLSYSRGMTQQEKWEMVVETRREQVRRLAVPNRWIYQTQSGLRYSTAPGTIGRERDMGEPEWGPLVFVPRGDR